MLMSKTERLWLARNIAKVVSIPVIIYVWNQDNALTFGAHLMKRLDSDGQRSSSPSSRQVRSWKDYRLMALIAFALMCAIIWFLR